MAQFLKHFLPLPHYTHSLTQMELPNAPAHTHKHKLSLWILFLCTSSHGGLNRNAWELWSANPSRKKPLGHCDAGLLPTARCFHSLVAHQNILHPPPQNAKIFHREQAHTHTVTHGHKHTRALAQYFPQAVQENRKRAIRTCHRAKDE